MVVCDVCVYGSQDVKASNAQFDKLSTELPGQLSRLGSKSTTQHNTMVNQLPAW